MTMNNIYGGLSLANPDEDYGDAATRKKRRKKRRTRRKTRRAMRRGRRSERREVRQATRGLALPERRKARSAARKARRAKARIQRKALRASRGLKGTAVPKIGRRRKPAISMTCPINGQRKVIGGKTYICHNGKYMLPGQIRRIRQAKRRRQQRQSPPGSAYTQEAMAMTAESQQAYAPEFVPEASEPQYLPGQEMVDTSAYWDGSSGGGGGGGFVPSAAEDTAAAYDEEYDEEETSRTPMIIGAAVILAAAGAGYYYYTRNKAEEGGLEGPEAIGVTN